MTGKDLERVKAAVKECYHQRVETLGLDFRESDFLSGIAAVFEGLDALQQLPTMWVLRVLAGRPMIEEGE